jgi:hypothetical protein
VGQWVSEERNIYEDYRKLFGKEPPQIGAVAIMTDTDDTQDEVTAWYGDIFLEGENHATSPRHKAGPAAFGPGSVDSPSAFTAGSERH